MRKGASSGTGERFDAINSNAIPNWAKGALKLIGTSPVGSGDWVDGRSGYPRCTSRLADVMLPKEVV